MPLLLSRQMLKSNELNGWLHKDVSELNVIGTYNLINNAALLLNKSPIYIITIDKLLNDDREIIFKKNSNQNLNPISILHRKNIQVLSKAGQLFLDRLIRIIG